MYDTRNQKEDVPSPLGVIVAILFFVAIASVMVLGGPPDNPGSADVNAALAAPSAPAQIVSPGE